MPASSVVIRAGRRALRTSAISSSVRIVKSSFAPGTIAARSQQDRDVVGEPRSSHSQWRPRR